MDINKIEKICEDYEAGKMLRQDSEVEISICADQLSLWDYSASRGGSEFIRDLCLVQPSDYQEVQDMCNRHGWFMTSN